jgi:hypothetical protein
MGRVFGRLRRSRDGSGRYAACCEAGCGAHIGVELELESPCGKDAGGVDSFFPLATDHPNVNRGANTACGAQRLTGFESAPLIRRGNDNR